MNSEIGYCHAWPNELKAAWRKVNRLQCKVRCLSSNMEKISYEDFDDLMCELEKTQQELYEAHFDFDRMKQMWDSMMPPSAMWLQREKAGFCNIGISVFWDKNLEKERSIAGRSLTFCNGVICVSLLCSQLPAVIYQTSEYRYKGRQPL